jgi:signal transduction histidine kinase
MSGNGVDIAAVYQLLREVADRVIAHDNRFATMDRRFDELSGELAALRKEVQSDIASLRQTVTGYHMSVLGHGILISELESRVRRIEEHLNLPPAV